MRGFSLRLVVGGGGIAVVVGVLVMTFLRVCVLVSVWECGCVGGKVGERGRRKEGGKEGLFGSGRAKKPGKVKDGKLENGRDSLEK